MEDVRAEIDLVLSCVKAESSADICKGNYVANNVPIYSLLVDWAGFLTNHVGKL